MKQFLLLVTIITVGFGAKAQGYNIKVTSNYKSGIAYLTYHFGKNYLIQDSAVVNKSGVAVFAAAKKVPPGIYAIVFPGKKFVSDFLIDGEQTITIVADTNAIENIQVKGSPANDLFAAYQSFVSKQGKLLDIEKKAYKSSTTKADSLLHQNNYKQYNDALNAYRESIIQDKPTTMMAALLQALKEAPYPTKIPTTKKDSTDNYHFYKENYFNGISFLDDRILRTPFFLPKFENYYREVLSQNVDSLKKDIDYKLLLARSNPEMFKFLLNWFTDEYINPKYMGQDAIFVHLFEKYHSKGISNWLTETQQKGIERKAYMLMSNLVGEPAANLALTDTLGNISPLYDVNAAYTVVVFWDPTCGHCKEEIPRIDSIYRATWKKQNIKIYAVLTETEKLKPDWLKYINEHNISEWVNVYQSDAQLAEEKKLFSPSYRQLYDITLTPTLYLLDKNKNIVAKKLSLEQMDDFLKVKINSIQK